jgi:hypothetical protein
MVFRYEGNMQICWIISRGQPTRVSPPAEVLGTGLTTLFPKNPACYEMLHIASGLAEYCEHGNESSGSIKSGELLD